MPAARSTAKEITFEEAFRIFLNDSAARGLAEKTLKTYRTHLRDISHYFDITTPLGKLSRHKMNLFRQIVFFADRTQKNELDNKLKVLYNNNRN